MAIDIRRTFDNLLRKWGHDVLLQRKVGDGWANYLERHTVRYTYPTTRGLPQVAQEQLEGITRAVDVVYYFRRNARPKEGDRIYEEDDRYPGGQETYIIDYALAMNGRNGEVDYYAAGCTRETPN